jgi:hypothetical protein
MPMNDPRPPKMLAPASTTIVTDESVYESEGRPSPMPICAITITAAGRVRNEQST